MTERTPTVQTDTTVNIYALDADVIEHLELTGPGPHTWGSIDHLQRAKAIVFIEGCSRRTDVCDFCVEPLLPGEQRHPTMNAHIECAFSNVVGHYLGACGCSHPDLTVRQVALLAWSRRGGLEGVARGESPGGDDA